MGDESVYMKSTESGVDPDETGSRPRRIPKEGQTLDAQHDQHGEDEPTPVEAEEKSEAKKESKKESKKDSGD